MKRRLTHIAAAIATTACAGMLVAQNAAAPPARPDVDVPLKSCVTAECHVDVKQHKHLHGPVNVDACDACHVLDEAATHTFSLTRAPEELCGFCHVLDTEDAKVVHQPLKDGQCMSCHDPHGGFNRSFLKGDSMAALCNSCHQDVVGENKHVHGPVAAGACATCHQPHMSELPNLLLREGRDLCVSCHAELDKQLAGMKFVHEAAQGDCQDCHDPHASNFTMMVRQSPLTLCTEKCHQPIATAVADAKVKHSAVTEDTACVNCHSAHGSDLASLMIAKPADICMNCHAQPVKTDDGRTVAAVTDITREGLVKHGPVADGSCGGCHNVHGSDHARLLTKSYPAEFYTSFKVEKFDLCFECHDKQLVLLEQTKGLTGFRNGEQNLHYVHVNKDRKGRTCRACHSTHASKFDVHIRESVPFGSWELPINYSQTESGGSCEPGCHQPFKYDRDKPVDYNHEGD